MLKMWRRSTIADRRSDRVLLPDQYMRFARLVSFLAPILARHQRGLTALATQWVGGTASALQGSCGSIRFVDGHRTRLKAARHFRDSWSPTETVHTHCTAREQADFLSIALSRCANAAPTEP